MWRQSPSHSHGAARDVRQASSHVGAAQRRGRSGEPAEPALAAVRPIARTEASSRAPVDFQVRRALRPRGPPRPERPAGPPPLRLRIIGPSVLTPAHESTFAAGRTPSRNDNDRLWSFGDARRSDSSGPPQPALLDVAASGVSGDEAAIRGLVVWRRSWRHVVKSCGERSRSHPAARGPSSSRAAAGWLRLTDRAPANAARAIAGKPGAGRGPSTWSRSAASSDPGSAGSPYGLSGLP